MMNSTLLMAFTLLVALGGHAQVKRTNSRTSMNTRTTQQKPVEKRWCCYEYGIRHMALADSVIYI